MNDIPAGTAAAIFEEWEGFARYGFNKSHAVDYAVIAVQTAYLKLHYPFEYMTALLSVSKNDTDKVALYVADARRMGLGVEPPDINASEWDFAIEDCKDNTSVIRFGLGAVKNVGQGAVETIFTERQNGLFRDINDFARRVDLRLVGRRALECLTKVGALDGFGQRTSLLESLDSIIAISTAHFRAAESGQMSLFGQSTGVIEEIHLKPARNEVGRKEILNWERELIGLYITDHPLSPIIQELEDIVTHYSGQLADANPEERVRMAGIITRIRNHQTKSGQAMAFVTMEDLQGTVDLVIFPRTWERVAELVKPDQIVLVDGKIDSSGGDPKILVDNIVKEFTKTIGHDAEKLPTVGEQPNRNNTPASGNRRPAVSSTPGAMKLKPGSFPGQIKKQTANAKPADMPDSSSDHAAIEEDQNIDWDNMPPPPEEPPDWYSLKPATTPKIIAPMKNEEPKVAKQEIEKPAVQTGGKQPAKDNLPDEKTKKTDDGIISGEEKSLPDWDGLVNQPDEREIQVDTPLVSVDERVEVVVAKPPVILPPQRKPASSEDGSELTGISSYMTPTLPEVGNTGQVRMLTVVLRASSDKTRDVLRLRRIHGMIMTYPGDDRFAIQVFEKGRGYLLEFPNFTTGITQELLDRLHGLVGVENIRVDLITFH